MTSIPALAPSLGSEVLRSFAVPPDLFIPSEVISAWQTNVVPYGGAKRRYSPAQRAGLSYQRRIVKYCASEEWNIVAGQWYCYTDLGEKRRYCQPDILLKRENLIVVVEVKLRWTANAWWQLQQLYLPVLKAAHPGQVLIPLCICKSYDPAIVLSEPVALCADLFDARPARFNVLVVR